MIHINELLITPLTYAAIALPFTWIIGKAINKNFSTLIISFLTAIAFATFNYFQYQDIELAAQMGLLTLLIAALIKLGFGLIKLATAILFMLGIAGFFYFNRKAISNGIREEFEKAYEININAETKEFDFNATIDIDINMEAKDTEKEQQD